MVVRAPKSLMFGKDFAEALQFLGRVRRGALLTQRGVFVDLSRCSRISPVVCLLLCAEIERCNALREHSVNGCDPASEDARQLLRAMGFHEQLGIAKGKRKDGSRLMAIRSGDQTADIPSMLEQVAEIAHQALGDRALANRVHGALNEAMLNVTMHAYDPEFLVLGQTLPGRWWVAGVADHREVIFLAYDQGVGIAATAPKTVGEGLMVVMDKMLATIGLGRADARDHHFIEAAIRARRTRTGMAQHGKGLTSMIQLVELAGGGAVQICSHGGQYIYSLSRTPGSEPVEGSLPLEYKLPGTLIIWHLERGEGEEVRSDHADAA